MATTANWVSSGLAARLDPRTTRISRRMADAILREVPHYAADPDGYTDAVLQRCRLAVRIFVRIVATGQPPGPREIGLVRRVGRSVAAGGEPLEPLLHALRIGARVGWEETLSESRREPALSPAEMLPLAGQVFEYIDQLSSSMAEAYLLEAEEEARRQAMSESRLFEALAAGQPPPGGIAAITMEAPRVALAVASREAPAAVSAVLGRMRARLDRGVLGQRHGLPVWLLPREPAAALLEGCAAGTAVVFGVSASGDEVPLSRAVDEAAISAAIGLDSARPAGVLSYPLIYPYAALRSDPAALSRFHAVTVGPLRDHPELLETLREYFFHGRSVGLAAARVHRHRQTAVYRLKRVEELTGMDLSDPEQAFRLEAAIRTLGRAAGPIAPAPG